MALKPLSRVLRRHAGLLAGAILFVALFAAVALPTRHLAATLGRPALVSGYALLALVLVLFAFNARKKLPMVPASTVSGWRRVHVLGGVLALALFWLHTGSPWPAGRYEQALALLFYGVTLTGLLGLWWQKVYPRRLTQSGVEVIFERIPDELARMREEAEATVLECNRDQGSDTLARFYLETFQWFFRRPRFLLSHLGGSQRAGFWVDQRLAGAGRYLGEREIAYLDRLGELAHAKARLDLHYAVQGLLRAWLLVHVPLSVALLAVAGWHLLLTNVYVL